MGKRQQLCFETSDEAVLVQEREGDSRNIATSQEVHGRQGRGAEEAQGLSNAEHEAFRDDEARDATGAPASENRPETDESGADESDAALRAEERHQRVERIVAYVEDALDRTR